MHVHLPVYALTVQFQCTHGLCTHRQLAQLIAILISHCAVASSIPSAAILNPIMPYPLSGTPRSSFAVQRLLAQQVACVTTDFLIDFLAKPSRLAATLLGQLDRPMESGLPSQLPHVLFGSEPALIGVLLDLRARLAAMAGNRTRAVKSEK